jgi:hypothetical protein
VVDGQGLAVSPQRIQRQRTKGWRMPEGATYVGRPTKWGNPNVIHGRHVVEWNGQEHYCAPGEARGVAVRLFAEDFRQDRLGVTPEDARRELAGRDLVCWCPLDQPCHADVLLELANGS